jgi:hypothetical protein
MNRIGPIVHMTPSLSGALSSFRNPVRGRLDGFGPLYDLLELRAEELAEIGKMRAASLTSEEQTAKLLLDLLDRPCQRWLGHVRALGSSGEIQCLAYRQEITDLVHLHDGLPQFPKDALGTSK